MFWPGHRDSVDFPRREEKSSWGAAPAREDMRVLEEQITICHGDREPRKKPAGPAPAALGDGADAEFLKLADHAEQRVYSSGSAGPPPHLLQLAKCDLIVREIPSRGLRR